MIYDCFSFFNELDILELRLKTLCGVVDKFVVAESNYTHSGAKKPLLFLENRERFAPFLDKIIHVVSPDPTAPERASTDESYRWTLEYVQRNASVSAIVNLTTKEDFIIVSDIDEIPSPSAIHKAVAMDKPVRLRQKMYYYWLNNRCRTTPYWHRGPVILPMHSFDDENLYASVRDETIRSSPANEGFTASKIRFFSKLPVIKDGGWHFSYMGGIEMILAKLNAIAEGANARRDESYVRHCVESGNDPYDRGEWYCAETLDDSFPSAASDYPHMIFDITPEYLRRTRFKRHLATLKGIIRPLAWKLLPNRLALKLSRLVNRFF